MGAVRIAAVVIIAGIVALGFALAAKILMTPKAPAVVAAAPAAPPPKPMAQVLVAKKDLPIGYRLTDTIEVQLNATNLFDERYLGTINSGGTGNSGDRQTLLVAAPQQFFVTLKAGF